MLSQLKENNRILKERLKCLKKGNSKASYEAKTWLDDTESIDASFRRLKSGITRLVSCIEFSVEQQTILKMNNRHYRLLSL